MAGGREEFDGRGCCWGCEKVGDAGGCETVGVAGVAVVGVAGAAVVAVAVVAGAKRETPAIAVAIVGPLRLEASKSQKSELRL